MENVLNLGDFITDLTRGKQGEEDILELLEKLFGADEIIDLRDNKQAQAMDLDFLVFAIRDGKRRPFSIEVKTDYTQSENFFAEIVSCSEKNTLGNWLKTKADYILYYFKKRNKVYVIPTHIARQEAASGNYREVRAYDKIGEQGNIIKTSIGALIPINVILTRVSKEITSSDLFMQPSYEVAIR